MSFRLVPAVLLVEMSDISKLFTIMMFLIKGVDEYGSRSLAHRLAVRLDARPPRWPLAEGEAEAWEWSFGDRPEVLARLGAADARELFATRHIHADRVAGLLALRRHRELGIEPPAAGTGPEELWRWMSIQAAAVLKEPYLQELFGLVCGMVESMDHPVLDGAVLGMGPRDPLLTRMLLFKYQRLRPLKILLVRSAPRPGAERGEVRARVEGIELTVGELLERISLGAGGEVELDLPPGSGF